MLQQFFVRQVHNLVADFIVQMPLKVKELRNRGDETARIISAHLQEGLHPPTNLPRDFEYLMYLVRISAETLDYGVSLVYIIWESVESKC